MTVTIEAGARIELAGTASISARAFILERRSITLFPVEFALTQALTKSIPVKFFFYGPTYQAKTLTARANIVPALRLTLAVNFTLTDGASYTGVADCIARGLRQIQAGALIVR